MSALELLHLVSGVIGALFLVCYAYQLFYIPVALRRREEPARDAPLRRYAVLISARNEAAVITQLLETIRNQDYPAGLITVFVVADNCTDSTAQLDRQAGAQVYERFDRQKVGKVPYVLLLLAGAITTATRWQHIHAAPWKRVAYTFTFPLFILSYIPITIAALFGRVEWKPIEHKAAASIQQLK